MYRLLMLGCWLLVAAVSKGEVADTRASVGWIVGDSNGHLYFVNGPFALVIYVEYTERFKSFRNTPVAVVGRFKRDAWGQRRHLDRVEAITELVRPVAFGKMELKDVRIENGRLYFGIQVLNEQEDVLRVRREEFGIVVLDEERGQVVYGNSLRNLRGPPEWTVRPQQTIVIEGSFPLVSRSIGLKKGVYRILINHGDASMVGPPCSRGRDAIIRVEQDIAPDTTSGSGKVNGL